MSIQRSRLSVFAIAGLVAIGDARLAPAQEYKIIHSWVGNRAIFNPNGPMAIDSQGNLYGLLAGGVFKLSQADPQPGAGSIIRVMTKLGLVAFSLAIAIALGPLSDRTLAQHKFEIVTGKAFDSAMPKDFYLEGNAIPTEKRNAALIRLPSGARALFALIDTSGYSTDVQAKYAGMLITEGDVTLCGHAVSVGSYGFGWSHPATGAEGGGTFSLYDQSGAKITECATTRDAEIKQPRPLQVVIASDGSARLYYGRQNLELK